MLSEMELGLTCWSSDWTGVDVLIEMELLLICQSSDWTGVDRGLTY